jgi:hypothetical protein
VSSLQADLRAAAVALFTGYAADAHIRLQVYPGRPRSINPPTAFVDLISERISYDGLRQRMPTAVCIVVHGLFDTADTAGQKDAFVDGFVDWVYERIHAAGANTTVGVVSTEDIPAWQPDWMPTAERRTYYATQISLEGFGG